jgi:Laminin G domain
MAHGKCGDCGRDERHALYDMQHNKRLVVVVVREVTTSAQFPGGDGSIELPSALMVHRKGASDTIRITITTTRPDGLILWRGQKPTSSSRSKDYIALFLINGYVTLRYCSASFAVITLMRSSSGESKLELCDTELR